MREGNLRFIGEVARDAGLSPKTIRYYESIGLIAHPVRSEAGYRLYTADVLPQLRFIRVSQSLGLKLAEIREIVRRREDGSPCDYVGDLVAAKIARLQEEIERMGAVQGRLRSVLARWEETSCQAETEPMAVICPRIEAASVEN